MNAMPAVSSPAGFRGIKILACVEETTLTTSAFANEDLAAAVVILSHPVVLPATFTTRTANSLPALASVRCISVSVFASLSWTCLYSSNFLNEEGSLCSVFLLQVIVRCSRNHRLECAQAV